MKQAILNRRASVVFRVGLMTEPSMHEGTFWSLREKDKTGGEGGRCGRRCDHRNLLDSAWERGAVQATRLEDARARQ